MTLHKVMKSISSRELITNNGHLDKLNQNHNQKGDITKMDIWRQDYGQQLENWNNVISE